MVETKEGLSKERGKYSWILHRDHRFFVRTQKADAPADYPVQVQDGYDVRIGHGKLLAGRGIGIIEEIIGEGDSFFSGDILVVPGLPARIPFPQAGITVAPQNNK